MSRFLHTMLRVGDLQRSIDFYTKAFGMKELRRRDVPDGKYTLAFVGVMMQGIDTVADALGDPNLKDQISASIGDARMTGRVLLGISVITIAARLRTIKKGN